MKQAEFEQRMRELLPTLSEKAMANWNVFAEELDRGGTIPMGKFYDQVYVELSLVVQHQGEQTASALFNYGEQFTWNPFEIRGAASLAMQGIPLDQIRQMALEDGCDCSQEELLESRAALEKFQVEAAEDTGMTFSGL